MMSLHEIFMIAIIEGKWGVIYIYCHSREYGNLIFNTVNYYANIHLQLYL